jgi:hypothetical protein
MYYAKLVDGVPVRCNISDEIPDITFTSDPTEEQITPYGVVIVNDARSIPEHNEETHGVAELTPEFVDGKWYATYEVIEKI